MGVNFHIPNGHQQIIRLRTCGVKQKMWGVCVCVGILLSHKQNETLPFVAMWMDPENNMLSEINQRQILYNITYMWNNRK